MAPKIVSSVYMRSHSTLHLTICLIKIACDRWYIYLNVCTTNKHIRSERGKKPSYEEQPREIPQKHRSFQLNTELQHNPSAMNEQNAKIRVLHLLCKSRLGKRVFSHWHWRFVRACDVYANLEQWNPLALKNYCTAMNFMNENYSLVERSFRLN